MVCPSFYPVVPPFLGFPDTRPCPSVCILTIYSPLSQLTLLDGLKVCNGTSEICISKLLRLRGQRGVAGFNVTLSQHEL